MYDPRTGVELQQLATAALPLTLAFQPEGNILAASLANNNLELWDVSRSERSSTLIGGPQHSGTYRLGFSADGNLLVSAGGPQLQLWDWRSSELRKTIENVFGLGLSPNSPSLATLHLSSQGVGRIRIYDLTQNDAFIEIPPDSQVPQPTEFSFDPKSGWLATIDRAYASQVDFWDLESKSVAATFDLQRDYDGMGVLYFPTDDFTPDGYFLVLRSGPLTTPEAQPNATGLSEALWACGFALIDIGADRTFFTGPMLYDDCAGPPYLYDMTGKGSMQVLSPDGGYIAADDGFGSLRVWGIDPSMPPMPPECSGDCPVP
jgi:WD40 repeat protein